MKKIFDEFAVEQDDVSYKFRLGKRIATALSGFIAGLIVASMVWIAYLSFQI
ncbi:MAG: hypothetical protein PHV25_02500 [Candidatus Pacebacteria bacterium]|nr:hypothetical protein [Candidatus Paceibacterota bacterium]